MQTPSLYIFSALLLMAALFPVFGYPQHTNDENQQPAIGGYSPVSYFTKNIAEQGSADFAVEHRGTTYYLSSEEQVELFAGNPEMYRPRYQVCPYSLTLGGAVPLDPTNFKIVGGSLLLFHKTEESDGLKLWDDSPVDEQTLLELADKEYILLRF